MASSTSELTLTDADMTEAWLRCFAAAARSKKLKDDTAKQEFPITDLFLAKAGVDAIRRVSLMAHPLNLEEMPFEEIRKVIMNSVRPHKKLVIAERVKFLSLRQGDSECVQSYVERLRQAARFCDFQKLGDEGQTIEDDMIQMTLIDGLREPEQRIKTLEFLQSGNPKVGACIDFVRQLELIKRFSQTCIPSDNGSSDIVVSHVDKNKAKTQKCKFCGYTHPSGKCPAFGKTCSSCGKKNHFQSVCRSSSKKVDQVETEDTASVFALQANNSSSLTTVKLDDQEVAMQVDTGSQVTLIPRNIWQDLGRPVLKKCGLSLKQFDGSKIALLGKFEAVVESHKHFCLAEVIVADCNKSHGLLGMDVLQVDATSMVNTVRVEEVGRLKDFKADILLKPNAHPTYFESRPVPIHMKQLVIKKLNELIHNGLLERVPPGGSKWASPLVVVRKADGDLRICADYKVGVNPRICSDSYPTPSIEVALHKLHGSQVFAKIDLKGAYNQIEMNETAREITTINTPIGLLRWTCLPYGIKTASAIFQRAIEGAIGADRKGVVIYQDDICVGADSPATLQQQLKEILDILKSVGMKINERKCVMEAREIRFLGYKLSKNGVSPDSDLIQKVLDLEEPRDLKELSSFLGLVNFYGRFISNFSDKLAPLLELRKSRAFEWKDQHQSAFERLKSDLAASPVVRLYNPAKELTVTTDASEKAISAILSQENHPILYLSRSLTAAERNYSNIEREALAIVWTTLRARQFLLGRHFTLISDHRPLEFLFNSEKPIPKVTSARLMRWALHLSAYDYKISYAKGNNIPHADALSRLKFKSEHNEEPKDSFIHLVETDVVNLEELRQETSSDPILRSISQRIRSNKWGNCSPAERPYKQVRQELSIEEGIICRGDIIIPPKSLRRKFITAVHCDTHCGYLATRNRLRLEAWWPGFCNDVELFIKECPKCAEIKPPVPRATHKWPQEEQAWSRVHMDHAFEPKIGTLLILVDSFSGWPEVVKVGSRSAETVKHVLRTIFSRNGVPQVLVSDNAKEFHDETLCNWLKRIGCKTLKTPPYHPQSNGLAERMVATVKLGLKAYSPNLGTIDAYLSRMLLSYRSIPHGGRTSSPSAMMGRQIRSPMTMSFHTGEPIWYRPKTSSPPEEAKFISQAGNNTAVIVRGNNGTLAHTDQINQQPREKVSCKAACSENEGKQEPIKERNIWSDFLLKDLNNVPRKPLLDEEEKDEVLVEDGQDQTELRRSTRSNFGQEPFRYGGF